ncbi:hypothetical protein [Shewanella sp. ECSMB14101]|uniref:hypothetical protein n=1 Tax=Shewanella sp. ECSMB14101 TaxID=1565129 RepID=UPI001376D97B|nr:hypothetical protein [Shewanella sp. ECSMB14101]
MCKHVFGTPRALPCGLYEIIPDFEGQKRVYTDIYRLFDLTLLVSVGYQSGANLF